MDPGSEIAAGRGPGKLCFLRTGQHTSPRKKGTYVLHLLREELGEDRFWRGIKAYTRPNRGKPATTNEFRSAMEKAGGKSLSAFFAK
jgi:hypothetical protein